MITVKTEHPIAVDSLDHTQPWGTANDNNTSLELIEEIENHFGGKRIAMLDIGCSGGQIVIDMHDRGHTAVGIEGSDYSLIRGRACWAEHANKQLFTCDATKPYEILEDGKPLKFDCIMSWEVIEHIKIDDLPMFFANINNHLKGNGIFIASISKSAGDFHHVTVLPEDVWLNKILLHHFGTVQPYPFNGWLRNDIRQSSFVFLGTKKWA